MASDLVYTGDLVGASSDAGWIPISGEWQVADGLLTQVDPTGYDYAIGYEGNTFQSYALQVSLAHLEGVGGGVLFNMPQPYQLNGSHMVRYSDGADAIFWRCWGNQPNASQASLRHQNLILISLLGWKVKHAKSGSRFRSVIVSPIL